MSRTLSSVYIWSGDFVPAMKMAFDASRRLLWHWRQMSSVVLDESGVVSPRPSVMQEGTYGYVGMWM